MGVHEAWDGIPSHDAFSDPPLPRGQACSGRCLRRVLGTALLRMAQDWGDALGDVVAVDGKALWSVNPPMHQGNREIQKRLSCRHRRLWKPTESSFRLPIFAMSNELSSLMPEYPDTVVIYLSPEFSVPKTPEILAAGAVCRTHRREPIVERP